MVKSNEKSSKRMTILLVGLAIVLTFFLVNAGQYAFAFFIYIVLGALSIFFYVFWGKISKETDLEGLGEHWIRNSFIGIGLGIVTIILGQLFSFIGAIGIPSVPQSIVSSIARFVIIVPSAMIFESAFFLDFVMDFLQSKLKLNKWLSLVIMAIFASIFHLTAYGGSLVAGGGSFFSAFLMFFLFGALSEWQNDLSGAITWHGTLNAWIGFVKLNVIVV